MRRFLLPTLAVLLFAATEGHVLAQLRSGLIPPPLLRRYGLERSWHAQIELDSAVARVAHIRQHVSSSHGLTVVDVVLVDNEKQKLATFTDRDLDAFGKPLGPEGAKKEAEERIAQLAARGVEAKAVTTVVPEITLYATSDNGVLHAINGETGATRWVVPVGRSDFPTFAPAANDFFVAAINGITLYVFDAADGRLVWSRRLSNAPGAGPALTYEYVHVPMVNGVIESYHLTDPKAPVRVYQSFGRAMLQPVVSPASVIWATDRGHIYVGNGDRPGIRFRIETREEIVARPAWMAPNLVVGTSLDGDVYASNEFTGGLLWRFSTGDEISHSPVAIGEDIYVITDGNMMYRLSARTGGAGPNALWSTPGVRKFLAASKTRIYAADPNGRLMILDRASGGRIATLPTELLDIEMLNQDTDRLFLGTDTGLIQCVHETGLEYPIVYTGAGAEEKPPEPKVKQEGLAPDAEPAPAEPANPFGGGAAPDPFGGAVDPFGGAGGGAAGAAGGAVNPFGGGAANPFGGGAAGGADGGGADPFGGGGAAPMNTEPMEPAAEDPFGGF